MRPKQGAIVLNPLILVKEIFGAHETHKMLKIFMFVLGAKVIP